MRAPTSLTTLLVCAQLAGCKPREEKPASAPPQETSVQQVTGCRVVANGKQCEVSPGETLSFWVDAPEGTELSLSVEGSSTTQTLVRAAKGGRVSVQLPDGARSLRLGQPGASFELTVSAPEGLPVLGELKSLRAAGRLDEATQIAREKLNALEGEGRARLESTLARLELARGNAETAQAAFKESSRQHAALGRLSDAADDAFALSFTQLRSGQAFAQARTTLDEAEPWASATPEGRARMAYYRGILDVATGDVRAGLERLRSSVEQAERFEILPLARNGRQEIAALMLRLARYDEAMAELEAARALTPAGATACDRVGLLINLAWASLLAREADAPSKGAEPGPLLDEALAALNGGCEDPHRRANVQLNRALEALQRGAPLDARDRLLEADRYANVRAGELGLWREELRGRLALLEHRPAEALQSFEHMAGLAEAMTSLPMLWRAELGAGRALEAQGKLEQALQRYGKAESLLDGLRLDIPLSEGRDSFLGDRLASARRKVALLWRQGKLEEALESSRRARARALSSFALAGRFERLGPSERKAWEEALTRYHQLRAELEKAAANDWKLSREKLRIATQARHQQTLAARKALDEAYRVLGDAGQDLHTRALDPGTLLLAYFPVEQGWLGFARTSTGLTARLLELPEALEADALSTALLEPFSVALEAARRIRIVASGRLTEVDFHALPWRGQPLIAHAPVEYSLDLGGEVGASTVNAAKRRAALVVADARGDLPHARAEAAAVERELASSHDVSLLSGTRATREQVLRQLGTADVFHYAGHGAHSGAGGWDSALRLADRGALTVSDILALKRAPRHVVLSGCETARGAESHAVSGLGLARAFVLSGSHSVIAASRTVPDVLAQAVGTRLHQTRSVEGEDDPAVALQQTQLESMKVGGDWSAFRVTVP